MTREVFDGRNCRANAVAGPFMSSLEGSATFQQEDCTGSARGGQSDDQRLDQSGRAPAGPSEAVSRPPAATRRGFGRGPAGLDRAVNSMRSSILSSSIYLHRPQRSRRPHELAASRAPRTLYARPPPPPQPHERAQPHTLTHIWNVYALNHRSHTTTILSDSNPVPSRLSGVLYSSHCYDSHHIQSPLVCRALNGLTGQGGHRSYVRRFPSCAMASCLGKTSPGGRRALQDLH